MRGLALPKLPPLTPRDQMWLQPLALVQQGLLHLVKGLLHLVKVAMPLQTLNALLIIPQQADLCLRACRPSFAATP